MSRAISRVFEYASPAATQWPTSPANRQHVHPDFENNPCVFLRVCFIAIQLEL